MGAQAREEKNQPEPLSILWPMADIFFICKGEIHPMPLLKVNLPTRAG